MRYRNIIFDFGGVLIHWDPSLVYRPYFKEEAEISRFYQQTGIFELNKQLDKGLPFEQGLAELAAKFPHYREPILFWRDRWLSMIGGVMLDTVKILENLYHRGYALYGLTNWSDETFSLVYDKYHFFRYFKDIVVSGRVKAIKPDREIFDILLQRNNLAAESCLFIDDNLDNVRAAQALGMGGVHFVTAENLEQHLISLDDRSLV